MKSKIKNNKINANKKNFFFFFFFNQIPPCFNVPGECKFDIKILLYFFSLFSIEVKKNTIMLTIIKIIFTRKEK